MNFENPVTINITTENAPGVLQRVSAMFTRRRLNIESLTVAAAGKPGLSIFTIVLFCTLEQADRLIKQIRKIVEVQEANYVSRDSDLLFKEIAFLRIHAQSVEQRTELERIAGLHAARIISANRNSVVLEKIGKESDIDRFLEDFGNQNISGFIRSGRIAIPREEGDFSPDFVFYNH